MNAEQFTQFLEQQNKNFQTLLQQINNNQVTQSSIQLNVSNFEKFDKERESFQQYKERFENFLTLKGLASDKDISKAILLNSIGPEYFELLKLSVAPREVNTLNYDETVQALDGQLTEKKNIIVERHKFLSQNQGPDQSVQDFVTQLHKYVPSCEFQCECKKSVANLFLHSQFIRGLSNSDIRHQLLLDNSKTFQEAVSKAQTLEASLMDNKQFECPVENSSTDINRVCRPDNTNAYKSTSESTNRMSSRRDLQDQQSPRFSTRRRIDFKTLGIEGLCLKCARSNHTSYQCKIDRHRLNCRFCKLQGHVEKVCIKRLVSEKRVFSQ